MTGDLWCPNCNKKGLCPYGKDNTRPYLIDDIYFMSCLYCDYRISSKPRRKEPKSISKLVKEREKDGMD